METLKQIPYGDGRYSVSDAGNVYNNKTGRKLKPNTIKGYKQVKFYPNSNISNNFLVHRLVAKAFIENPFNLPFVNHLDKDPSNNNKRNLEWCTASRNVQHSYDTGRVSLKGNKHPMSKLDEYQVTVIRTLFKDLPVKTIAEYFKVDYSSIENIRTFKTWAHPL